MSSTKYSPAATDETEDVDVVGNNGKAHFELKEPEPPLEKTTCFQKFACCACSFGFIFMIVGVVCAFVMKPIVQNAILGKLPLVEGEDVYKGWKDPPINPVLFLRVFNLTNEADFLAGRAKPSLKEVGPYAYRQEIHKVDVHYPRGDDNDEIAYRNLKYYEFSRELSAGDDTKDFVIVPNVPLFGAMAKMEAESDFAKEMFASVLDSYEFATDTKPFLKLSVRQFLFGYDSLLMSLARANDPRCAAEKSAFDSFDDFGSFEEEKKATKGAGTKGQTIDCDIRPGNLAKFGLFLARNGTKQDRVSINSGKTNLTMKGDMISYRGLNKLDYWSTDECNTISDARDPGAPPMNLKKDQVIDFFFGNLCRKIQFKYIKESKIDSFKTLRFAPFEFTLDNAVDTPENACYCPDPAKGCLPSGLLDISTCQAGSPIIISWPHFLYGDPTLKSAVDGLSPDQEKHRFYFDIEPKYGITLAAFAKMQMNVRVTKGNGFGFFDRIRDDELILPFAWLDEGILGPTEAVSSKVQMLLTAPDSVSKLMALGGLVLGLLLMIPEIGIWLKSCLKKTPKETMA